MHQIHRAKVSNYEQHFRVMFDLDSYTTFICEHPQYIWYHPRGWFIIMCKECLLKETNI